MKPPAKGWCPSAYRPMMSGDGLIVRVRPRLARLARAQALGLCDLAQTFGSGVLDLTSRANLQMRGVTEAGHPALIDALRALDLLDDTPEVEARRTLIATPLWQDGDLSHRLHDALCTRLADLPDLPAKVGYAIDTGPRPILSDAPADFRFERAADGGLILRFDGASRGRPLAEAAAIDALIEMAQWFVDTGGTAAGRMARHVPHCAPPTAWVAALPAAPAPALVPGHSTIGPVCGAPFGSMMAQDLAHLIAESDLTHLRLTPWRLMVLEGGAPVATNRFVTTPTDPLLGVRACPGAPACAAATVDTRSVARAMAPRHRDLHVSGCAKGCASPRVAALTLVGRDGAYDLVEHGHPWDEPRQRGLTAQDLETI